MPVNKHEIGDSFTDLPSLEESKSANWAPTMTVEGVEYYQVYSQSELWKAKDDTNNVLFSPETIENDVFIMCLLSATTFHSKKTTLTQMGWAD